MSMASTLFLKRDDKSEQLQLDISYYTGKELVAGDREIQYCLIRKDVLAAKSCLNDQRKYTDICFMKIQWLVFACSCYIPF